MFYKISKGIFIILSFLLCFQNFYNLKANLYYVKTNGNNNNSGLSWALAWRTITHSCSNVIKNDTIYVSNGIYNEQIYFTNSGTSLSNLNIASYNPQGAILLGSGSGNHGFNSCVYLSNIQYIKISGFVFKYGLFNGIVLLGAAQNNIISNNFICSNNISGIYCGSNVMYNKMYNNYINGGAQINGILLNSANNNIIGSNNFISKNGQYGIHFTGFCTNNLIIGNIICSNGYYGVFLESSNINSINTSL